MRENCLVRIVLGDDGVESTEHIVQEVDHLNWASKISINLSLELPIMRDFI